MLLNIYEPIRAAHILKITCHKVGKVYQLYGIDGSSLILKNEGIPAPRIKSAGIAVSAINPEIKMKMLSEVEYYELQSYCDCFYEIERYYEQLGGGIISPVHEQKAAIDDLIKALRERLQNKPMCKMITLNILRIEDVMEDRGEGKKEKVRDFVAALKRDGGLESLGQVVAGDLFNGNTDRFFPTGSGLFPMKPFRKKFGPFEVTLKVIVNFGNVVVATKNGGEALTPKLFDYVDPLGIGGANIHNAVDENWLGHILVDPRRRHKYCEDIIQDLENILHPKKAWYSFKTKLGRDAVSRLETGMLQGKELIKQHLIKKLQKTKNQTPGIEARYAILCK